MNFTIILPVFGNSPWLEEAIESVLDQQSENWHLIIADDGADEETERWINERLKKENDDRIEWRKRERNLGLFANINEAIKTARTDWLLLLCSDDLLTKNALTKLKTLYLENPNINLILSSFISINADGSEREADSSKHHDIVRKKTGVVMKEQLIPELLRLGSLNGNLTGMAFRKQLWIEAGAFKESWRHAADWEWMIRASERGPILLNRTPIAIVRTHEKQLSVQNRKSGDELVEVASVVKQLLEHPLVVKMPEKSRWAGHVMQFQLWNLLKQAGQGVWTHWPAGLVAIHKSAGLRQTIVSMLYWLPSRWEKKWGKPMR